MVSLKKLLTVTAVGALIATPAFAQMSGGTGGSTGAAPAPGIGAPGTTMPGGGLTPATPPSASPTLEPTPSTLPPRPTESTPAPGLDNPTGAIRGTFGSTPSGTGGSTGGATSTPLPQGGTTPSTAPGSSTIQR